MVKFRRETAVALLAPPHQGLLAPWHDDCLTIRITNLRAGKRRFERGMTLPEVLVAFVISSVAISAIVSG